MALNTSGLKAGPGVEFGHARLQVMHRRCGMERERFALVRLHPALNGDREGEHPYFRSQDGASRWPAVHVKDAASLYRLAIEQAPAGAVLNAVGDEGVPVREIAEAIGRQLHLPARSLPAGEYEGMLVPLLSTDMPAASAITQELLGWKPTHPGLIEDIEQGHYFI
jgi:nucleoside-diphosphate-sugar epimerase